MFLGTATATATVAGAATFGDSVSSAASALFRHGVASGDPLGDRVILWSRVSAAADTMVPVRWVIASDPGLKTIVNQGVVTALPERDHTVKVDALGLPHPRSYGTFPRIIAKYVRKDGVLTLEDAIRKMTSWPAARMKLADRGMIKPNHWADVVIFDYETIADNATWEQPLLTPSGIGMVLVNGVIVAENGQHTGARPGHVLYGPGKR